MYTSQHGYWRFDRADAQRLRVGAEGRYSVMSDGDESYIRTDKFGDFYFDFEAYEQTDGAIKDFNREQDRQARQKETNVIIHGNQVLVPVILGYGEFKTEAFLLLDTGASLTLLHREIANKLRVREIAQTEATVVGGSSIPTDVTRLSYLQVGPHRKEEVYVGIIDHEDSSAMHQGLLGMDVLRNLEFHVDFQKKVIRWKE